MNIVKILLASALAGTVVLSSSACAQSYEANSPDSSSSASPASPTSPDNAVIEADSDIENVLATVNGYYGFISQPDSNKKITTAGAELTGRAATDEELQEFATDFSEGFQYFDTSDSQRIKDAYKAMMLGSGAGVSREGLEIIAPADGVTIDGDTATFNTTWISVTAEGKEYPTEPEPNPEPSDLINLVKKDDGTWVIVAKGSASVTAP